MEASQPDSLHDLAVVSLIFPNQQIRDSTRVIEVGAYNPSGDGGHLFAVQSRPEAEKATIQSTPLFSTAFC